jgi:prepilin-type N-terminal cleavage/methylation domain-containing protein
MENPSLHPARRSGFTLLELIVAVSLVTIALATVLPDFRRRLDHMAVVAAREEAVGLFHRARTEAVARGGATILLTSQPSTISLLSGEGVVAFTGLEDSQGVRMTLSGNRAEVELNFDPLGLGRVASQTLTFSRGTSESRLIVSSYGRLERE